MIDARVRELEESERRLIEAAQADERAHRERAGICSDGVMGDTAEWALSWLLSGLEVERRCSALLQAEIEELRATIGGAA